MISRTWLRVMGWLHLVSLPRLRAHAEEEHASLVRAERIRSGDFLDDLLTGKE